MPKQMIKVEWRMKEFTMTTSRGVTYTKQNQQQFKLFIPEMKFAAERLVSELNADDNCYNISMTPVTRL